MLCGLTAQTTAPAITGRVIDAESGEPLAGATVMLQRDTASTPITGTQTGSDGRYTLEQPALDRFVISIRMIGYETLVRVISASGTVLEANVSLTPRAVGGREVVIRGERELPVDSRVGEVSLRPSFVDQLPAFGGEVDIMRALQLLPGISSATEASTGLYVRGSAPDQNMVLLDGAVVFNPSHLGGFLSTFHTETVDDIRLVKGGFPAEYGGRLASVVDVTTRDGSRDSLRGSASVSLLSSSLALEAPITDDVSFLVSGRRMYLDLLLPLFPFADSIPRYYFHDLNGKLTWWAGEHDKLTLTAYYGRDVMTEAPIDDEDRRNEWGNQVVSMNWIHTLSPEASTTVTGSYSGYTFETDYYRQRFGERPWIYKSQSQMHDFSTTATLTWHPTDEHFFKAGGNITWHSSNASEYRDTRRSDGVRVASVGDGALESAAFVQDQWRILPPLTLDLGVRLSYFASGDYLRPEPRLAIRYDVAGNVRATAAASTTNQYLHLVLRNDIPLPTDVWYLSNDTLLPATGYQLEGGIEVDLFGETMLASVEGYYKQMDDLVEYREVTELDPDIPLEFSFTTGKGTAYGVEFLLQRSIGSLTGWLAYTLSWTERTFPELNNGKPFPPRFDRRHDISAVATYKLDDHWKFSGTWVYGTGQAYTTAVGRFIFDGLRRSVYNRVPMITYTDRNGYRLPDYHKLDLGVTYSTEWLEIPWEFSLYVYNVYNRRNVFAQYYDSERDADRTTRPEIVLRRVTFFPILPTFGIRCRF
jgi:hypothetical protein